MGISIGKVVCWLMWYGYSGTPSLLILVEPQPHKWGYSGNRTTKRNTKKEWRTKEETKHEDNNIICFLSALVPYRGVLPIPLSWSMHSLDFCHSCVLAAHFLVVRNLESLWTRSLPLWLLPKNQRIPQIIRCQSADHSVSDVHAIRRYHSTG